MTNKRTIFIWDIHWCFDEFELLIEKLQIKEQDTVYIVWDMINKGPKSWKIIKYLYKNREQFQCIKWNHEIWFLDWVNWNKLEYWNDIYTKLESKFKKHPKIYKFFQNIPLYIDNVNFLVIHGWLNPNKKIEDHNSEELTEIREINDLPWFEQYKWDKKVIYWHWAQNWLNITNNTIWLDGWCVYWRALHAYILETGDIITQQALECYVDVFKKNDK